MGSERDYSSEMSHHVSKLLSDSRLDFVPAIAARDLVELLRKTDTDLLTGWLLEHAASFLADQIKHRLASARSRARASASRSAFASDARRFVSGELNALCHWSLVRYSVDKDNTQRRLLDMSKLDLDYVASRYSRVAQSSLLEEAFLRALAARVGDRTVGDVFSEEDIDRMYSSIQGRTSIAAS